MNITIFMSFPLSSQTPDQKPALDTTTTTNQPAFRSPACLRHHKPAAVLISFPDAIRSLPSLSQLRCRYHKPVSFSHSLRSSTTTRIRSASPHYRPPCQQPSQDIDTDHKPATRHHKPN
jgi:hypothetical protein